MYSQVSGRHSSVILLLLPTPLAVVSLLRVEVPPQLAVVEHDVGHHQGGVDHVQDDGRPVEAAGAEPLQVEEQLANRVRQKVELLEVDYDL